jgi:hypothetical protein
MPEKKEARIRQFLALLQRAVGSASAPQVRGRHELRKIAADQVAKPKAV